MIWLQRIIAVSLVLVVFTGCAATKPARDVKASGFLGDYSMLRRTDEKHKGLYSYINPKADWRSYSKVLLDPVVIWRTAELQEKGVPLEDLQRLANNFYVLLYDEVSEDYEMVTVPEPGTMRMQVALTDVEKSQAAVKTVTSVIPHTAAISKGKEFVTGKPAFVGEASVEFKLTDARTGRLLGAGVDRRVGGDRIKASADNWDDVNKIMELWSRLARFRLCKLRGEANCLPPPK